MLDAQLKCSNKFKIPDHSLYIIQYNHLLLCWNPLMTLKLQVVALDEILANFSIWVGMNDPTVEFRSCVKMDFSLVLRVVVGQYVVL